MKVCTEFGNVGSVEVILFLSIDKVTKLAGSAVGVKVVIKLLAIEIEVKDVEPKLDVKLVCWFEDMFIEVVLFGNV